MEVIHELLMVLSINSSRLTIVSKFQDTPAVKNSPFSFLLKHKCSINHIPNQTQLQHKRNWLAFLTAYTAIYVDHQLHSLRLRPTNVQNKKIQTA